MVDVLDVAYAVQVGQNEQIALALVGRGADPALVEQARDLFDEHLESEPEHGKPMDREQWELHRALGVV